MSRRELLRGSVLAGGALLVGFEKMAWPRSIQESANNPFAKGRLLGTIAFTGEAKVPMGTAIGVELDGRMYTDLSALSPDNRLTATEKFYIRTRASELLDTQKAWRVSLGGLAARLFELSIEELRKMAKPMGMHLMECAGNTRSVHFGMMSVADWEGAPLSELLESAKPRPRRREC